MSKELPTSNQMVQRLHGKCGLHTRGYAPGECILCDAADEIERLRSWLHIDDSQMWFACVKCGMAKRLPKDSISFICDGCQEIERLRAALKETLIDSNVEITRLRDAIEYALPFAGAATREVLERALEAAPLAETTSTAEHGK